MVRTETLEWGWWQHNHEPSLIEATYRDAETGSQESTYLDTAFISHYLATHEPHLFVLCCEVRDDRVVFSIDLFMRWLDFLDWDALNLLRDMINSQLILTL